MNRQPGDSAPFVHAQDKLAFLLALVPYLLDRDRVSVTEAAAHFQVSDEQVREAVRLIAVSGVPGETSQYQHGDLFDIAWDDFEDSDEIQITHRVALDDSPRFSAREAAALIAGLQYLQAVPETLDSAVHSSLMAKLARGASEEPSQVAVAQSQASDSLLTIRSAVAAGLQIEFDYTSSRGDSEHRVVDPLRIDSNNEDWYLRGWCHTRQGIRTFRLDRMTGLRQTDLPNLYRPGDLALSDNLFDGSGETLGVVLEVHPAAVSLLGEYLAEGAPQLQKGALVQTTVRVAHIHGLKRLIASLPGVVRVIDPPEARLAVYDWAAEALAAYDDDATPA
ncbi:helix-turn-helix transcriptional regulator [Subtercola boreus]|uniref:DNA-binding transcriptional regulator n=1 Tax=Subtercola boreus TaxID=120213 RepID=A0A3E0WE57_9MICO|nr:WYL domain-containing protein [Subtercola boreus]RFA21210.1 DNA-binding transcriptional regulator [Subtercola boreus]RFA21593.1 DNA-binding transcriptional regulator [Subtercola boreus]RFA27562.1 DNA-binding transcriptional regulator [Subtercola boreus]